jgi:hypothetical protein
MKYPIPGALEDSRAVRHHSLGLLKNTVGGFQALVLGRQK